MSFTQDNKIVLLFAVAILCVGLILGYSMGRSSENTAKSDLYEMSEGPKETSKARTESKANNAQEVIVRSTEVLKKDETLNEGGNDKKNIDAMRDGVNELIRLANANSMYDFKAIAQHKQALLQLAKTDSAALGDLLAAYADNLNDEKIQALLFDVVAQVKDPQVEALATELALSSDRDAQVAGFELLGELQIPSQENLDLSMNALVQDQNDQDLVLAAIHAMPAVVLSSEKNKEVVDLLSDLAGNDNEAIRSESLLSMAKWAKNEEDLSSVIHALDSDVNDDKISAAMALERSTVVGDNLKASLLAKVSDPNELWEVRAMSANALGRFDLSTSEFSELQDFRQVQVGGVAH